MKIKPEQIPELVFEACPSYREAWPSLDLGNITGMNHSIPILIGFAGHVARLWKEHRYKEFPAIFNLIERLHRNGNKKAVDHVVFYFTEALHVELQKHGINPRFAERRLGTESAYWLGFLKWVFGWN